MNVAPLSKKQAKYVADDLRRDYLRETFESHDGRQHMIYAVSIAPYDIRKRHVLADMYHRHLNRRFVTSEAIDRYLDCCSETEYTVVAIVGPQDEGNIVPWLYPIQGFYTNEIKVFAFNFLNA